MEKEVLEVPEKLNQEFMYSQMMTQLVDQKKKEFEVLKGKLEQYKIQLMSVEEACNRKKAETEGLLKHSKEKYETERKSRMSDMDRREEILKREEESMTRRKIALEERERLAENANTERIKLIDERVRYEKLNREAQEKFEKAVKASEIADSKLSNATQKEKEVNDKLNEVKNIYSIIEQERNDINTNKQAIEEQRQNLADLRREIEPKIAEYKGLVTKNEAILKQVSAKELSIHEKFDADNRLFDTMKTKEKELSIKERLLITKEEDLKRREMAIKK